MNSKIRLLCSTLLFTSSLLSASFAAAQQAQTPAAESLATYNVNRETKITGKVLAYTPNSALPPMGAHMTVQTVYGTVDVHLGNPKLLEQHSFELKAGDTVNVTGEVLQFGSTTTFAARLVEDGGQSIAVRNERGRLILITAVHAPRGVR
ncbi:MAG TPA: hypothetical protein VJN93_12595 [Candidatus Acidoferrum sp.]|nr:hypothetical protein [Candidatus Acidoferrum sp.]